MHPFTFGGFEEAKTLDLGICRGSENKSFVDTKTPSVCSLDLCGERNTMLCISVH